MAKLTIDNPDGMIFYIGYLNNDRELVVDRNVSSTLKEYDVKKNTIVGITIENDGLNDEEGCTIEEISDTAIGSERCFAIYVTDDEAYVFITEEA